MFANVISKNMKIKTQCITCNIRKPGDVGILKFTTFIKISNGLISMSSEIPASAYYHPLPARLKQL